jgi:HAMP domain-containing protein
MAIKKETSEASVTVARKVNGKKSVPTSTISKPKKPVSKKPVQKNGTTDSRNVSYERALMKVLTEVKNGNFSTRMDNGQDGINGRISETLNEIIELNEKMMLEFTKAGKIIGKQGKLTERIPLPKGRGSWVSGVDSLNTLISDLVHPTIEIAHVIGSVANGDLSEEMPMEIGGHALKGEFLSIAKEVNYMVKQLNLFSREVTRVAREVGSEGKLGGQARVKGVAGVWKDLTDSVNQTIHWIFSFHGISDCF